MELVSSVPVPGDEEEGGSAELRTYEAFDRADNRLRLVLRVLREEHQVRAKLVSLEYQTFLGRRPFDPGANRIRFQFKTGSPVLEELDQRIELGKGKARQRVRAEFDAEANRTEIEIERPGEKTEVKLPGLVLLFMDTRRGELTIGF